MALGGPSGCCTIPNNAFTRCRVRMRRRVCHPSRRRPPPHPPPTPNRPAPPRGESPFRRKAVPCVLLSCAVLLAFLVRRSPVLLLPSSTSGTKSSPPERPADRNDRPRTTHNSSQAASPPATSGILNASDDQGHRGDGTSQNPKSTTGNVVDRHRPKETLTGGGGGGPKLYSILRPDRSGAVIQDMLFAHAYSHREGVEYGGACPTTTAAAAAAEDAQNAPQNKRKQQQRQQQQRIDALVALIEGLGLSGELRIACPPDDRKRIDPVVEQSVYTTDDTSIFTPQWLRFIRSRIRYPPPPSHGADRRRRVVVHVRRGDERPCHDHENERYLPNFYYLTLLERYADEQDEDPTAAAYDVTIYSESRSYEPWDDFRQWTDARDNWRLKLDTPDLLEIWRDMMAADVLILSKSSFSYVPAIFNANGTVLYTAFWHRPLPHWIAVGGANDPNRYENERLLRKTTAWIEEKRRIECRKTHRSKSREG